MQEETGIVRVFWPELRDVSLIIPSYNRQPYLRRQIAYFWRFPVNLIIVDGSRYSMDLPSLDGAECSVEYIHVPGPDTYLLRLELAVRKVSTEYVMLLDDADLFLVTGIANALSDLSADPALLMAAGTVAELVVDSDRDEFVCEAKGLWSSPLDLTEDSHTKLLRVLEEARTGNLFYTVMRRETFVDIFRKVFDLKFLSGGITEIFVAGSLVIRSDFHLGNYPFWIRGYTPSIPADLYDARVGTEWHENPGPDRHGFLVALAEDLVAHSDLSEEEAIGVVEAYLREHYRQGKPVMDNHSVSADGSPLSRGPSILRRLEGLIKAVTNLVPFGSVILGTLRNIKSRLSNSFLNYRWTNAIQYWSDVGVALSVDQEADLRRYEQLVSMFPKGIGSHDELFAYISELDARQ